MGRNREPIELILAKGNRARKTKKEIRQRFETEIKAADDNIRPPRYLRKKAEKDKFYFIAGELGRIGIISNLDCDEIARYILSETDWLSYGQLIRSTQTKLNEAIKNDDEEKIDFYTNRIAKYESLRAKAFNQCHACASALGLTITSRCKLVVPKQDEPKENKFRKFMNEDTG